MTFPQGRRSTDRQDQTQAGERLLGRLRHAATRLTPNGLPYRRLVLVGLCSASVVVAQVGKTPEAENALFVEKEEGIPVTDDLVLAKCGSCHAPDAKGNMSRISWSRTTPEGWAMVIRRMVKLNGLEITPQESRSVIKYLSTWHGLAPEEAKPLMYIPEKRYLDETNIPNETVRTACAACHTFGQPLSWRRSKVEWKLLQNMHVALFSQADAQYNRPSTEPGDQPAPGSTPAGGTPPKPRKAGDVGYEYISKTAPLVTPQWTAWRPRIRPAKLSGTWLVSASVPGKGRFVGEMTIAPGAAEDEFTTSTTLRSLSGGPSMSRSGKGIAYAGYSWRGESKSGTPPTATPGDLASDLREAMYFSPDQTSAEGRWFWGEYQEFGYDVKLTRATGAPVIATATPDMLKAGVKGAEMRIYGHDLPATLTPADIDVGEGVKVTKVVSASPTEVVATVDVAADATSGWHDINVAGATLEKAVPVYHNIDYLKVTPETSLSRLGGGKHPKGYTQFEAIGFENGPDGKRETADDIMVGPIAADWSVEEFMQVYYDDDTKYVGSLSSTALFTPSIDGPNPERRFGRNNYGDVWVVAKAKTEKDKLGAPLTAKSFLIVTVPSYQRRDQPELGQ